MNLAISYNIHNTFSRRGYSWKRTDTHDDVKWDFGKKTRNLSKECYPF